VLLPLIGGLDDHDVPCRLADAVDVVRQPDRQARRECANREDVGSLPRLLLDLLSIGVVRMMRRGWSSREDAEPALQEPADCGLGRE
jgi:hypothetical protein